MNLNLWAIKWNIPFEAVEDLRRQFGIVSNGPKLKEGESEAAIQTRVRLEGVEKGINLMRNNVGVLPGRNNVPVRYGLMNDSRQLNKRIKSSDLIGIKPIRIRPVHLDSVIGQFVTRECKYGNWVYTATEEEQAQLRFLELMASLGADAAFANKEGTL